ncbi:MAG TPA: helix-turn-helix domain-containing protein [Devosiaceae bacterium]|nr:helix-turn-helix domain-containing protein [Devosiaceae bacterium]
MDVATEADRQRRLRDLATEDEAAERAAIVRRRQNRDFVQVYPKGFHRLRSLMKEYPLAAQIYAFLAEHIDPGTGAVVVSQELLAEELGVHRRTIIRATHWLDENNIVVRIKLGGSAIYAYCLDPEEVWKSFEDTKDYAAFRTKTLARMKDNGDVKRRLKIMVTGQQDLFTEEPEE